MGASKTSTIWLAYWSGVEVEVFGDEPEWEPTKGGWYSSEGGALCCVEMVKDVIGFLPEEDECIEVEIQVRRQKTWIPDRTKAK
jgi:hypothetical protein